MFIAFIAITAINTSAAINTSVAINTSAAITAFTSAAITTV